MNQKRALQACVCILVVLSLYLLAFERETTIINSNCEISPPTNADPTTPLAPTSQLPATNEPGLAPQSTQITSTRQSKPLACAKPIRDYIANNRQKFDANVADLITFISHHSLLDSVQEKFYHDSNTQPFYFNEANADKLKEKIAKLATCQDRTIKKDILDKYNLKNGTYPNMAICSYQSTNAQYSQEWISHYILLGVSKFYIYDNNAADSVASKGLLRALDPFVKLGYVNVYPMGGRGQADALRDCEATAGPNHDWISFLDADEYFTFHNNETCLPEFLFKLTQERADVGSLVLRWRNFNTQGVPVHDQTKTLYQQELSEQTPHEYHRKHIAYWARVKGYYTIHEVITKDEYSMYDGNMDLVPDESPYFSNRDVGSEVYQNVELRHFWGQSLEYMLFDKLCAPYGERELYMNARLEIAFRAFQKEAKFDTTITVPKHDKLLSEFLFGN